MKLLPRISIFLKGPDFFKGLVLASAIVLPIALNFEHGLSMAMGVLLSSASDVQGGFRHKVLGVIASASLAAVATVCMSWAIGSPLLLPVMAVLVFGVSYISVYGFRASLTTFAGLLAIALSLAHPQAGVALYVHAALILGGGLWYLLLSVSLAHLLPVKHTELLLQDTIRLTAQYIRAPTTYLAGLAADAPSTRLLNLQQQLNERHETLRELLISTRRHKGYSNQDRRHLLVFIELVDLLELAVANAAHYKQAAEVFNKHPKALTDLALGCNAIASHLEVLGLGLLKNQKTPPTTALAKSIEAIETTIEEYVAQKGLPAARQGALLLHNLQDGQKAMVHKLEVIERTLQTVIGKNQILRLRDSSKFITQQDYSPKVLVENFGLQSPILRHALRLTITVLAAYMVGTFFQMQNTYWIMLTAMVIMRPNYGLTRQRSRHRIIGTLMGAAIAVAIVVLTPSKTVYAVLSVISMVFAFSFIQKNYKTSAIFITLNIVLAYALLEPNALQVIQYRVLDTLIGVALAMVANQFLLPAWEYKGVPSFIYKSIEANLLFFEEITHLYHHKGPPSPAYKLARKQAFLAIGQLNAAFQRMAQDPPSQQKNMEHVYEAVSLNHTLLVALTGLGTFIRQHPTLQPSSSFGKIVQDVQHNLKSAMKCLQEQESTPERVSSIMANISNSFEAHYARLSKERNAQIELGMLKPSKKMLAQLQENRLMADHLKWLFNLSVNLSRVCSRWHAKTQLSANKQIN